MEARNIIAEGFARQAAFHRGRYQKQQSLLAADSIGPAISTGESIVRLTVPLSSFDAPFQSAERFRSEFMANLTHEIKTPLA